MTNDKKRAAIEMVNADLARGVIRLPPTPTVVPVRDDDATMYAYRRCFPAVTR